MVSRVEYLLRALLRLEKAPRTLLRLEKRRDRRTNGRTDGRQTITLRLLLDAATVRASALEGRSEEV